MVRQIKVMDKNSREQLDDLKKRLREKFQSMAEPMEQFEYTRENYDKLFPCSKVSTPIGEIKLGIHQFEKLNIKNRENLLGAMYQTLTNPIAVIFEDDKGKKAQLFSKSFKNEDEKIKAVLSAIAKIDGENVLISTHRRKINNIINKIKNPADLLYEKSTNRGMGTAGTDPDSLNLAISSDTQSMDREFPIKSNIPQSPFRSQGKI
jgi:hypothetical protein